MSLSVVGIGCVTVSTGCWSVHVVHRSVGHANLEINSSSTISRSVSARSAEASLAAFTNFSHKPVVMTSAGCVASGSDEVCAGATEDAARKITGKQLLCSFDLDAVAPTED